MEIRRLIREAQSLDKSNLGSWPFWARAGSVLLVMLIVAAMSIWFVVIPSNTSLADREDEEDALKSDLRFKIARLVDVPTYERRLESMRADFSQLLRQLPSQNEVPSLLDDISSARYSNGLDEVLFKPLPEIDHDFYAELPNQMVVTGRFHQLGRFVSDVAALSRIVNIGDFQIKTLASDRQSETPSQVRQDARQPSLEMSLTATTYRYIDEDSGEEES